MKTRFCRLIILSAALAAAQGGSKARTRETQPPPAVPTTVDEAVVILKTKWLSAKDLDWILRNPQKEVVSTLYRPFGTGVRNEFRLWGDNQALRDSCGVNDPEGCSVVILNRLWESVRADADSSLVRKLDCQFKLAEMTHINGREFYKLTTGELVKALQTKIDEQLARFAAVGPSLCQASLTLEVVGKPDLHCFVDARFVSSRADVPSETSLRTALEGFSSLNLVTYSHVPPKIILDFARKCQFPTPPYLYESRKK